VNAVDWDRFVDRCAIANEQGHICLTGAGDKRTVDKRLSDPPLEVPTS
jgi:hypothetical protein